MEVFVGAKLGGVHEDGRDSNIGLLFRRSDQREVALVQGTHGWNQADSFPLVSQLVNQRVSIGSGREDFHDRSSKVLDCISENLETFPMLWKFFLTSPAWMVCRIKVPFWVGHQTEDTARGIANAGDIPLCSVGIDWECQRFIAGVAVAISVPNCDLIIFKR